MDERDLELVAAAFDTLLDKIIEESDHDTVMTVYWFARDLLDILSGEQPTEAIEATAEEVAR